MFGNLNSMLSRRVFLLAALFGLLVVASTSVTFGQGKSSAEPSGVLGLDAENVIPNEYIVVYKENVGRSMVANSAETITQQYGATIMRTYSHALNGFAATLNDKAIEALLADESVAFISTNKIISIADTQNNPTWGLDRIDQRNLPVDNSYTYGTSGDGVHAYIIDTGVRDTHNEFTGRYGGGFDAIDNDNTAQDCNGHGTHVAGTVGGTTYGVAKDVTIYGVRVLDCGGSGTTDGVIAGVDWVTANFTAPAVANMSLGGGVDDALDNAVTNSIAAGVVYALAAGNESTDACNGSPARTPNALTVGSTTNTDARSGFSNFGTCVDVFAPGSDITSAWIGSDTDTTTISGTSMASPHVAGVVALYLEANPTHTPAQIMSTLLGQASQGRVGNPGFGSPNLLVCTANCAADVPPTPTPVPTVPSGWICSDGVVSIPDGGSTSTTMTVPSGQTITNLDVRIEAQHSYVGDLTFTLTHDGSGTSVVLMDRPGSPASQFGCGSDNVAATFDDGSGTPVENVCAANPPAIGGDVQPEEALSAFNGQSLASDWTLSMSDSATQDTGGVTRWCLIPDTNGTPPTATPTPGSTPPPTPSPTPVTPEPGTPHFTGCADNTGQNATMIFPNDLTIADNEIALATGDEIAIYGANDLCAGTGTWNGSTLAITAWGDDSQTAPVDGLLAGETMQIRVWDDSADTEYDNVSVTYIQGDGIYGVNTIHRIGELDLNPVVEQTINLAAGWNLVSSFTHVDPADLETAMSGIASDLVLMKNNAGQVYLPGDGINQIGNWNVDDGYQMYLSNPVSLMVSGEMVDVGTHSTALPSGWSIIAYHLDAPMGIEAALASLDGALVLAKNNAGQVFLPGDGINQIGSMQPGQGYQIYLSTADTLVYPSGAVASSARAAADAQMALQHYTACASLTGSNATVVLFADSGLSVAGQSLNVGGEVAAFRPNSDQCVGAAVWTGDNLALTVWGDDAQTAEIDGMIAGEALDLRVWQQSSASEHTLDVAFASGSATYETDALLMSNRVPSAVGMLSNQTNSSLVGGYIIAMLLMVATVVMITRSRRRAPLQ